MKNSLQYYSFRAVRRKRVEIFLLQTCLYKNEAIYRKPSELFFFVKKPSE